MFEEKKIHDLKLEQPHFDHVFKGFKTFEIRANDRDFEVGDILQLKEYDKQQDEFTGSYVTAKVIYILDEEKYFKKGYIAMSIQPIRSHRN